MYDSWRSCYSFFLMWHFVKLETLFLPLFLPSFFPSFSVSLPFFSSSSFLLSLFPPSSILPFLFFLTLPYNRTRHLNTVLKSRYSNDEHRMTESAWADEFFWLCWVSLDLLGRSNVGMATNVCIARGAQEGLKRTLRNLNGTIFIHLHTMVNHTCPEKGQN